MINMNRFFLIVFCLVCFTVPSGFSAEDVTEHAKQLINDYILAARGNDAKEIQSSWKALNNNPEALNYMRGNLPKLDYLFRVRGLYMQLEQIQVSRPEYFGGDNPTATINQSVNALKRDLSPQAVVEVPKFSISEKDKSLRRTNRDIVMDSQGQTKIDNRAIALGNPNQNRISNEEIVESRKDRMFSSKFQQAPGELVPRGNSFPKSKPTPVSDAVVRGLASRLTFQNSSDQTQTVDIYLNDALVGREVSVSARGRTFDVYFVQGVNKMQIISSQKSAAEAGRLEISLEGIVFQKEPDWSIQSGQTREWTIEASI